MIYLDYAATAPVFPEAAEAAYTALKRYWANPSAQYPAGLEMKRRLETWRAAVAGALDCPADRLFFTSCGTEGDNWAIAAACRCNRRLGRHIVTTAVEHSAVLETVRRMVREEGYEASYVKPDAAGVIRAEDVLDAVRPDTALVSMMLVNNELGNRYPVEAVARGLRTRNGQTLLHTDAVQGFLQVPFTVKSLGADFVTVSGHKVGAPKGIGTLYIGPRVKTPVPLLTGGGQEGGLRSGTEATAQIAAFAVAVERYQALLREDPGHMASLRTYALGRLGEVPGLVFVGGGYTVRETGPGVFSNVPPEMEGCETEPKEAETRGTEAPRAGTCETAPHILAFALPGWPSQNVVNDLGEQGICISAGSACHRGRPSHVVQTLGLPPRVRGSVLRASFGWGTTEADLDALAEALCRHRDSRMPML